VTARRRRRQNMLTGWSGACLVLPPRAELVAVWQCYDVNDDTVTRAAAAHKREDKQ